MMGIDWRLSLVLATLLTCLSCASVASPPTQSRAGGDETKPDQIVVPPGTIHYNLASATNHSTHNATTTSSSEAASEEIVVRKPAAVKFSNANGQPQEGDASLEEFRDQQQRILRREHETHEQMLRQEEERKVLRSACFHVPEEFCEAKNFTENGKIHCPCKRHPFLEHSYICCNVTDIREVSKCLRLTPRNETTGLQIHIRNATLKELHMNLVWWKNFERISVTDGHINKLTKVFSHVSDLKCLNVSNNNLTDIDTMVSHRTNPRPLRLLDLSQNNLTDIPNMRAELFPNLTVSLRDNPPMLCKVITEAIKLGFNFAERNQSRCLRKPSGTWYEELEQRDTIAQLYRAEELQKICPKDCKCSMMGLEFDVHHNPFHRTAVDCSHTQLTELPDFLPPHTTHLNVSYNNITNLRGLNQYASLMQLYADYNQISSISDLEGTDFKDNFEKLSLQGNKLKQIPMYLLTKTLDNNPLAKEVHFAGNKLNCDCNTATELRQWLVDHKTSIKDIDQIECENLPEKVLQLKEATLCQSKHDAMDYIFFLIAAEVLLLLALILKVSYDYYVFKTQSYLPWPANKMPKLPCDWLCES